MMKNNIINILTEIIDLLNRTNWIKQAEWYNSKLELIKKRVKRLLNLAIY